MNKLYFVGITTISISLLALVYSEDNQPSILVTPAVQLLTPEQITANENATRLQHFIDPQLADGFDFPIGDVNAKGSYIAPNGKKYSGWYIATNFAEN